MATVNKAILIGKLTNEVQLREVSDGLSVSHFNLEVADSYTDKAGERHETTTRVDIEIWGVQAENCAKYLSKGREVLVEGRLKLDKWQDQEGNNRSRLLVRAKNVTFLGSRRDVEPSDKSSPPSSSPPTPPIAKPTEPGDPPEWDDLEEPPF